MANHQGDLFGGPSPPLHRLFFALLPSASERMQVAGIVDGLRASHPHTRWVNPERYHLTLHYLGESSGPREDWIARAREAAEGFSGEAFHLQLDHLLPLGNPRRPALTLAAFSSSTELLRFWRGLQERLIWAGFKDHVGRIFVPHLTLGYSEPGPATPAVASVGLAPDGFVLIQSIEGQSDYTFLGHWRLGTD
ncbi:2'-5' RNA ligase family protein [Pseudoxanthomonas sp. PXM04]|uniref:2'-5' RNA ligase family protein n=1 Tax=Pseudoxanthomonas sp. PXM04 TaxID=2769297 RepID=UPI0031BACF47